MGVETIKLLSEIPEPMMKNLLGKAGIIMSKKSNGIDESPVIPYTEQKSIGKEETFNNDTIDIKFLMNELVRLTEQVSFNLKKRKEALWVHNRKVEICQF